MRKIAKRSHAHARCALPIQPEQCALFAFCAEFEWINRMKIFDSEVLERLKFDRKSVHIPTRNERRPFPVE